MSDLRFSYRVLLGARINEMLVEESRILRERLMEKEHRYMEKKRAAIEKVSIHIRVPQFLERQALGKQTRKLQLAFDDLVERIKIHYCFSDVKKALKKIPHAYSKVFKEVHTMDDLFLKITLPISWFHYDVLKFLLDELEQGDISECKVELVEYGVKLMQYFEERVKPLTEIKPADNNHSSREAYIMNVDRNWDPSVLEGENCNKTCRKIASILGKSGCIVGDYHEPWLVITVS